MTWGNIVLSFLAGPVFALPFVCIKRYALRAALCVSVPLAIDWWLLWTLSDPVRFRIGAREIALALGGVSAAHLRPIWLLIRERFRRRT
jgi:hypothetical protein